MKIFDYVRPATVPEAIAAAAAPGSAYLAAGTNLLDLMKGGAMGPDRLVDVMGLPGLDRVERLADGGVRIGALVRNAELAHDADFARAYPAVAEAILSGASAQVRNAATVGGNLMQRTRCSYFYDVASACNRREPGAGCDALHGENRLHAVLGWSEHCIATHPSDVSVPLVMLDADYRDRRQAGSARDRARNPSPPPRRHAGARERARAGGPDRCASPSRRSRALRGACALSQASRAHLFRLCARVRRRGARTGRRRDSQRPACPWRRCGEAVARASGRRGARGRKRGREGVSQGGRSRARRSEALRR